MDIMFIKKSLLIFFIPFLSIGQSYDEQIHKLFVQKQFYKAEQIAITFVEENPNNLEAIELLADAYSYQRKWKKAAAQYKMLVNAEELNANYHYKYGGALGMRALEVNKIKALGLIGDIKRSFVKAAQLDPEHVDTRWALVELYMQLPGVIGGSKRKALRYANELENLSKVDGYLAKGYIYEYDKELDLAETYYKKALTVGGSITCYQKLSDFYSKNSEPKKAISTIERSYKKHNKNALHYQIGKIAADYNIELDKGERCLNAYIKSYSARDGVPVEWAYYRLAQISKNRLDKEKALRYIDKALSLRTNFKQALEEKQKILEL